jgi:hypothetical protein
MVVNRHEIRIKSDKFLLAREIVLWGEASWWPKRSLMRFVRLSEGPVQKGTRYRQMVLLPFAPSWDVEVDSVAPTSITRRFLNGMFKGFETISFMPQEPAAHVVYEMYYEVQGALNRLLWPVIFRKLHDRNIEEILAHLKKYLEEDQAVKSEERK